MWRQVTVPGWRECAYSSSMRLPQSVLVFGWVSLVLAGCESANTSCTSDCGESSETAAATTTSTNAGSDASESETNPAPVTPVTPPSPPPAGTPTSSDDTEHATEHGSDDNSSGTTHPTTASDDPTHSSPAGSSGDEATHSPPSSDSASETTTAPNPEDTSSDSSGRLRAVPVGSTDLALGFWEYLPPGYGDEPVPLLVFTHGASWQGEGTEETLQKLLEVGPPNLISTDQWPNSRPFLVLAPQNPHSGCFTSEDIDALYTYALATYNIDTKRIYHTGQSCGAIGSWNYLADHTNEHVTAAVLISGDGRDAFAKAGCDLGKVAIWGLHNEKDQTVPAAGTIETINSLMACDPAPDVKLTIYPDETAHDAWTKTYDLSAGNDIYAWLLEHQHE